MMVAVNTLEHSPDNRRTREDILDAILNSGEVSRIGQHLTLVLFCLCDVGTCVAKLSLRDLEDITGWSRQTITNHILEIKKFFEMTPGKGRGKTKFEMHGVIVGVITEHVNKVREDRSPATTHAGSVPSVYPVVANQVATIAANQVDTSCVVANQVDAVVANQVATNLVAKEVAAIAAKQVAAEKEKVPPTPPLKENTNPTKGSQSSTVARAQEPVSPWQHDDLCNKLLAACNGATSQMLGMNLSLPLMWIEQGCDLERDILPTVRALSHGKKIKSWKYFSDAVNEARAVRLAGLPPVEVRNTPQSVQPTQGHWRDKKRQEDDDFARMLDQYRGQPEAET